jgi:hypothetical protein
MGPRIAIRKQPGFQLWIQAKNTAGPAYAVGHHHHLAFDYA